MEDAITLSNKAWELMNKKQKTQMVTTLGYKKEWARLGTLKDVVQHGGGMLANSFKNVVVKWKNKNPNTEIKW